MITPHTLSSTDPDAAWVALDDLVVMSFRGSAARAFLGRQLTCDVARLAPDSPQLGAWLTPKGRVLVLMRLIDRGEDAIDAIVPAALADEVLRRLRMFVMRDDVAIETDHEQRVLGLWGTFATTFATALSGLGEHSTLIPVNEQPALALLSGPAADIEAFTQAAAEAQGALSRWQRLNIEAGLPQIGRGAQDAFIPQMINLDRIEAVSFTKGCYPGQEIVARTQHLGRIKRRMFIARITHNGTLHEGDIKPGDVIVGANGEDIGGRVVNVDITEHDALLLTVLPLHSDRQQEPVRLHGAEGPVVEVFAPPYPLADPDH